MFFLRELKTWSGQRWAQASTQTQKQTRLSAGPTQMDKIAVYLGRRVGVALNVYIYDFILFATFIWGFLGPKPKSKNTDGLEWSVLVRRTDGRTTRSGQSCPFSCPKRTETRRNGRSFGVVH